ncbi:MAG: tRNA preQ1(34) S-adenosylmethionine ribosyltransferase-isomerase QueA [Gammaproteobacteria bacterium]|nr:tRNA preQ1(34) S-adenosylmethionine ribosyltransferase-isomerase QueA [Gammaproteobacteria bacterium]
MDVQQFEYELPEALIAQYPLESRTASRLLVLGDQPGDLQHCTFENLLQLVNAGDLLVVNDSRVLPARLSGRKPTGGKVEIMLERIEDDCHALVLLGSSKPVRINQVIELGEFRLKVVGRQDQFYLLRFPAGHHPREIFKKYGRTPLPPYISRAPEDHDIQRYQTVYARVPGAVAAPTAGLHFDRELLDRLRQRGVDTASVTLHVGAGTFQPVRIADVSRHRMHRERMAVEAETCEKITMARSRGGRIIAVGTTVVRALESAVHEGRLLPTSTDTGLFILPGFRFRVVDALITNFHLPKSTLLMMVSAFAGLERTLAAYQGAIEKQYRFYSYGDAMFVERRP